MTANRKRFDPDWLDDVYSGTRQCTTCGRVWPATQKHFYAHKATGQINIHRCRHCYREIATKRNTLDYVKSPKDYAKANLFVPWARIETCGIDGSDIIYLIANEQCKYCSQWYAPYVEMWHRESVCSFCAEDLGLVARYIDPYIEEPIDEKTAKNRAKSKRAYWRKKQKREAQQ